MQQINMTQFLLGLALNLLNLCIPLGLTIYFAIRLAIADGEISFLKRKEKQLKELNRKDLIERMTNRKDDE